MRLVELIVNRGVPFEQILLLFSYILPAFLEVTVPMALLLGVILGVGRLSSDSEIIALRASGVSLYQIAKPILALALVVWVGSFMLSLHARPWGNAALKTGIFELARTRATAGLKEQVFNDDFAGLVIYSEKIEPPGTQLRRIMISDHRSGGDANTVIAQIAADALGVPVHDVHILGGDTDLTPDCGKTSASRQTFVSGKAAMLSGMALRDMVLRHGNVDANAKIALDGAVLTLADAGGGTLRIALTDMPVNDYGYVFMAEETYDPPTSPLDEKGQGIPYAVFGYGAQIVELSVDAALGRVRLDKITTAHDVGRAINPLLVEGQIEGGVAQGIGMALMEDYQPGRTENLHDYLIPTIGDVPQFDHVIVEVADEEGPYGAKGLGEHVLIPTAPAILNAIRHATGAAIYDLPATPDKVCVAIAAAQAAQGRP